MRLVLVLATVCALSACQRTTADELVFEVARNEAAMPDCASLHLAWAEQQKEGSHYLLAAQFVATKSCMERWEQNLKASEFEAQSPHGEWVRSFEPLTLVSVPFDGVRRGVLLPIPRPLPGVHIFDPREL